MSDTDDLLRELHEVTLRNLLSRIKNGEEVKAADLEVARKFLADNGVNADVKNSAPLKQLRSSVLDNLPFSERN